MRRLLRSAEPSGRMGAAKPLRALRVAAVLDEFSRACLLPDVTLLSLDARLWRMQLAWFRPDLLFVESAWRGSRDSWKLRVASYEGRRDDTLARLVAHCRAKHIPTVFWNKEDPVHFHRFVDSASLFDFVFTTDEGVVSEYERACGKAPGSVQPLLFAAQPELHHPVGANPHDIVCFAGSYGEAEFPERRRDLEMLLDASMGLQLEILDRTARTKIQDKGFPERFRPYVIGSLDYRALADKYRSCKVFLNVNSVRESKTMFSRRVFELLACGASVVSSPSAGIEALFGDTVAVTSTRQEAERAIRRFLEDEGHRLEAAARGIRRVFGRHTYEDRLREVCAAVGVGLPDDRADDFTAFTVAHSEREALRFADILLAQELLAPSAHALLRGLDSDAAGAATEKLQNALGERARVTVTHADDGDSERVATRKAAARIRSEHVSCIAPQHDYGPELFASQVACLRFLDTDLIGKVPPAPSAGRGEFRRTCHAFVDWVHPHAVLARRTALASLGWSSLREDVPELEDDYLRLEKYACDDAGFSPEEG